MRWILVGIVVAVLAIQAWPYGRNHTNPPVTQEPSWESVRTRELTVRACFDCHSNETNWPWYSNIAPLSWLIQRDVDEGRKAVNYSEWDHPQSEADDSAETVREGTMPPWFYTLLRSRARLSEDERNELIQGLEVTFGREGPEDEDNEKEERGKDD